MFIGPTRYQWDNNGLVHVFQAEDTRYYEAWRTLPLRLPFYESIGHNPAKGGAALGWFGTANFQAADDIGLNPEKILTKWVLVKFKASPTHFYHF